MTNTEVHDNDSDACAADAAQPGREVGAHHWSDHEGEADEAASQGDHQAAEWHRKQARREQAEEAARRA